MKTSIILMIFQLFILGHIYAGEPPVGVILSLTGPLAPYGQMAKRGATLALKTLQKKRNLLTLHIEDDRSLQHEAALSMNRLNSLKVSLVIGAMTSASTLVAVSKAKEAGVPVISPGATLNSLHDLKNTFSFPICFDNTTQGKLLARFAIDELKSKNIIVFVDQSSDYGKEILESFHEYVKKTQSKVLKEFYYQQNTTSFSPYLTSIRSLSKKNKIGMKPDLILFIGYAHQAGYALKEAGELGIKIPFLGSDGLDDPIIFKLAGNKAPTHYALTHFSAHEKSAHVSEFLSSYKNLYIEDPGVWAAFLYDAVMLASSVVYSQPKTQQRSTILQRLINGIEIKGITGIINTYKKISKKTSGVFVKSSVNNRKEYYYDFFKRLNFIPS